MKTKTRVAGLSLAAACLACGWLVDAAGLRWNTSKSMPRGVYRLVRRPARIGEYVAACLKPLEGRRGRARGYLMAGACVGGAGEVLKIYAGAPGDTVIVDSQGVRIKGELIAGSKPRLRDGAGRELEVKWGTWVLGETEAWLASWNEAVGWDSRYFGSVSTKDIEGVAEPIWVVDGN